MLRELPEGLDEGRVVAGTGEVHGGFEIAGELGIVEDVEGATDVGFHYIQLATDLRVGVYFTNPFLTHGQYGLGACVSDSFHLLVVESDELVGSSL